MTTRPNAERDQRIYRANTERGMRVVDIAFLFDKTEQRIQQILKDQKRRHLKEKLTQIYK